MQKGELIVTGSNSLSIPLNGMPSEVRAYFKDEFEVLPCNPQDVDFLEYQVQNSSLTIPSTFVWVISWSVSGVREIVWHAAY